MSSKDWAYISFWLDIFGFALVVAALWMWDWRWLATALVTFLISAMVEGKGESLTNRH